MGNPLSRDVLLSGTVLPGGRGCVNNIADPLKPLNSGVSGLLTGAESRFCRIWVSQRA